MRRLIVSLSLAATGLGAQEPASIDPGMSRTQVVARLGQPNAERAAGAYTYLFYPNGCEQRCGTSDLVILRRDSVVDAIFRAPARRYTGKSSSPAEVAPSAGEADTAARRAAPLTLPATQGGHIPAGYRGGIVTAAPPDTTTRGRAPDPTETPGLRVAPRRAPGGATPSSPVAPSRLNPRDSLSPRIDERATHQAHPADRTQARESVVPPQRDTSLAPAARPAPNVPAAPFTGARLSPTDSARTARPRDTTRVRPPDV